MKQKIAIVDGGGFSTRWIEYCKEKNIAYKIVDPYKYDIVEQVSDCSAFMWHHSHRDYKAALFAKQLLYSLEQKGMKVFPDYKTTWHFDDKVGEMYLLEAVGAPVVPSYVFYTQQEALEWMKKTDFPKVFKLRGGAGSQSVKLVHNLKEARKLVKKAFGRGFSPFDGWNNFREHIRMIREGREGAIGFAKGFAHLFVGNEFSRMSHKEKGYAYFQDFIPNNDYDIRIIVIGNKAFYIKRLVRKGDFRASGSGHIIYEKDTMTEKCVEISFDVNKKLESQCTAYDYVMKDGKPLIVEISYGFAVHGYDACEGYYTDDMQFHSGSFNPQRWMVDLVVE